MKHAIFRDHTLVVSKNLVRIKNRTTKKTLYSFTAREARQHTRTFLIAKAWIFAHLGNKKVSIPVDVVWAWQIEEKEEIRVSGKTLLFGKGHRTFTLSKWGQKYRLQLF